MPTTRIPDQIMIDLKGVSRVFRTQVGDEIAALEDISIAVQENQFVTLIGPSGCGKSTLLKLVSGLLPVSTGEIRIHGELINEPYSDVGFVFQQPVLLPWRTVLGNVLLSPEMLNRSISDYTSEARKLLQLAGLKNYEDKYPRELSGGMQQRVSICRALVHNPTLLLMDEPFGALDAMTREEMSLVLTNIWESRRKTILFVTHSISEAVLLADRVIVLSARPGRVAADISIDLPRPRAFDKQSDPRFQAYADQLRGNIFKQTELARVS